MTEPYLKWIGGKRQILPQIVSHLPAEFGRYYEPFVGGGALFFHLTPPRAQLSDANLHLVRTYRGVRDDVEAVIRHLRRHEASYARDPRGSYYAARDLSRLDEGRSSIVEQCPDDARVAAWYIFLNKTAFNGLMRVNQRGELNTAWGKYESPLICDEARLRACSAALQGVGIRHADFERALIGAQAGDLTYLDPPYAPVSKTAAFTHYTAAGATTNGVEAFQTRVRDVALDLVERGVKVRISNSDTPLVRKLYAERFQIVPVSALRRVNCHSDKRGRVGEVLIIGLTGTGAFA